MSKPDFAAMTKEELKAYVRTHHDDEEAQRELFDRDKDQNNHLPSPS